MAASFRVSSFTLDRGRKYCLYENAEAVAYPTRYLISTRQHKHTKYTTPHALSVLPDPVACVLWHGYTFRNIGGVGIQDLDLVTSMSLSKKLTKVTPMSLTLAALLTLTVALLLFVSYLELSEPEHTLFSYKKFRPTPSPAKTSASRYGTFQNKCSKYGFSKRNVVQKDGSLLNELNAEITNITKGRWNLRTPELYATLTPNEMERENVEVLNLTLRDSKHNRPIAVGLAGL